ncbi:histidinol-phosphatase [Deltaproteobacteria bacterium TL4]
MGLTSLHGGHSGEYCDHAAGSLESVIQQAVRLGFSHYGLSEHMPRSRNQDLYPEERSRDRTPEQLQDKFQSYFKNARILQNQYQSQIQVLVGMETEVLHSGWEQELISCRQTFHPDYLVGSVHHIREVPIDYGEALFSEIENQMGGTESIFCEYYDAQYQLMRKFHPQVIGHFDLIRLYRSDFDLTPSIWNKINRNLDCAIQYGALFEVNARAFHKNLKEPYPQALILKQILEKGGKLTLGDDSHGPDQVGMNFDRVLRFLQEHGVDTLHGLQLNAQNKVDSYSFKTSSVFSRA